jgi:OmpA-OmpF porin, OOP family
MNKSNMLMKIANYTLLLALLPFLLSGQVRPKWEWGLFAGGANYLGDLVETEYPVPGETNPALGAFVGINIGYQWTMRMNGFHASLSGDDANFKDENIKLNRMFRFESRLTELSLMAQWEPFGRKRYPDEGGFNKIFSPYLFAGVGLAIVDPGADFSLAPREGDIARIQEDKDAGAGIHKNFTVPFGGGFKIDVSKRSSLGLELGLRNAFSDYLDGVSRSGNPEKNDWYLIGGLALTHRMGPRDTDDDGIIDKNDACPRIPGVPSARGCPDADGDGVEDLEDLCPDEPGPVHLNGCPDRDGDGVIDIWDECPDEPGSERTAGCPDRDGDEIADKDDACPDHGGPKLLNGCPDLDEDGVIDRDDECPDVPGLPEYKGCPFPDADKDGVRDEEDKCPDVPGEKDMFGCPDTDGDGIPDHEDKCPNRAGPASNGGCPEITKETLEILDLAMRSVKFETASAVLKAESLNILDQVAGIMEEYQDYSLKIHGHTDSRGDDKANQELSERRAEACLKYLLSKGIERERMEFKGFGESKPIADNRTARGRSLNRRVEFELFLK